MSVFFFFVEVNILRIVEEKEWVIMMFLLLISLFLMLLIFFFVLFISFKNFLVWDFRRLGLLVIGMNIIRL